MRRWIAALTCVGAMLLTSGCTATPPGIDGDPTNGWGPIGKPTAFRPAAGTCHEELSRTGALADYQPVQCGDLHVSETVYVGTLTGAGATAAHPPSVGSAAGRSTYRRCSDRATAFVGRPWRTGLLSVTVEWPSASGWAGGARWFRCELTQADLTSAQQVSREGSLRQTLASTASLRLGCFNPSVVGQRVDRMQQVDCTEPHRAEFVGVWKAPEVDYAMLAADRGVTAKGCRSVIARYTGVPDDTDVQFRSGWISYNPTRDEWQQGERGVRCFLWLNDEQLTHSLKGVGPAELPIKTS